jgi:hypothetical protein
MQKFNKAQEQNKLSIERHLEANTLYSSSEDENDVETNENDIQNVVDQVLQAYQGQSIDAEKVMSYLINSFQSSNAVCLICISTIKKTDPVCLCSIDINIIIYNVIKYLIMLNIFSKYIYFQILYSNIILTANLINYFIDMELR